MTNKHIPFHPIIYVRGYAMTEGEIDDTAADPFCGFNLGSTVYRATPERGRPPRKYVFESPVVRLASDFGYEDVYEDGYDILDREWSADPENKLSTRSIVIYRYYDSAARLLGADDTPSIETFARRLGDLIVAVRDLACANRENRLAPEDFRCYLVAHSMGGLICRALLQNPELDPRKSSQYVDKFFTYATPHGGISMGGISVPSWLGAADLNNFSPARMAKYLNLEAAYKATDRVDWLPEASFSPDRVFTMVGTNRMDYEVALGASRTFAGHGSDGLVRIENATLRGLKANNKPGAYCAKAFAYRAHSGYFGVVNSEEAYQNLTRFLFGDVRVDIWVDLEDFRLPGPVEAAVRDGKPVNALYQVEVLASPRGKLWYLSRRMAEEDSVACLSHEDWKKDPKVNGSLYLSTVFLANRSKVNPRRRSLAYSMTLGIRVPDYEIDKRLWANEHYEGGYLYRNSVVVEMTPPKANEEVWRVRHAWQNQGSQAPTDQQFYPKEMRAGKVELSLPFDSPANPGVRGQLRFVVSAWNADAVLDE